MLEIKISIGSFPNHWNFILYVKLITERSKKHDVEHLNFIQFEVKGQLTQTWESFQICTKQLLKVCIHCLVCYVSDLPTQTAQKKVWSFLLVGQKFFRHILRTLHLAISVGRWSLRQQTMPFLKLHNECNFLKVVSCRFENFPPVWISWPLTLICTKFKLARSCFFNFFCNQ